MDKVSAEMVAVRDCGKGGSDILVSNPGEVGDEGGGVVGRWSLGSWIRIGSGQVGIEPSAQG